MAVVQARRMRVSSRNHLRRRKRRDEVRARMKSVQTRWGTRTPMKAPGREGAVWWWC